jgi:periplasmic protein TonB
MGNLIMSEYESPEEVTLPDKTEAGVVKHNGSTVLESRTPPFGRQTRYPEAIEPDSTMANDLLDQNAESQTAEVTKDGCELDLAFGVPVEETRLWVDLYEGIRDIFFPPKLPPLELTSTPIPVHDRMAVKRNPWAYGISTTVNVTLLLIVLFLMSKKIFETVKPHLISTPIDVAEWKAPKAAVSAGGGGGSPDKIEAIKGRIPPRAKAPDTTPKVDEPPLPSIDVQNDIIIPDNARLPNFGQSNSPNVKLGSLGNGSGMGLGSGNGNGYGPGSGWNIGGGLAQVGGRVSAPIPLNNVEAEFSDEARRAKYQGVVLVSVIVDTQGYPQNPRVIRALGMGLDEKAIEAVRKYRFKPAMRDGKTPVAVMVNVEVNFHLY